MNELIVRCLFLGGGVLALLSAFWRRSHAMLHLSAALCVAAGVLGGLLLGLTLEELLTPVLLVFAVAASVWRFGKEDGDG